MEILNFNFKNALRKIHYILGLDVSFNIQPKKKQYNPLEVFEKIKKRQNYSKNNIKFYDEDVLNRLNYVQLPHINLVREGILPNVQKEFNVMFDMKTNRILFPHRYWSSGDIVGIFGRTVVEDWELLGIPKYLGVIPYPKSLNLYGLYENYKHIQEYGCVIIFEGEKSVMKAKSIKCPIGVSLGGHELSYEQEKILIGLDVDIIFALDKDIDEQVSIDMCKRLNKYRNTYYIYDKWNLLDEKDAPIDKGFETFSFLLKHKFKVN